MRNILILSIAICGSLLVGADSTPSGNAVPEYGRGHDVHATAGAVAYQNNTLFMTWPTGGERQERFLVSVDIENPAEPRLLDKIPLRGFPQDLVIVNKRAYIVNGLELLTVDTSNPAELRLLNSLEIADDPLQGPQGIARSGDILWIASRRGGIRAVDVSRPDAPRIVSSLDLPVMATSVAVAQKLFIAADTRGLLTLDVSNPAQPNVEHQLAIPKGSLGRMLVVDNHLFAAAGSVLVACLAVNQPGATWLGYTEERFIQSSFFGSYALDIKAIPPDPESLDPDRHLVAVADGESGLIIADITRPERPYYVGSLRDPLRYATALAIKDKNIYVADDYYGLIVVDISRPAAPAIFGKGLKLIP